jgi:phosphoribosylformylglycinamidine synthase I
MVRALVLRAPGINCDRETACACRLAGFETELVHINFLRKAPERLLNYAFFVIPGGFSYGDDLGAGTLLAKNLTIHLGEQLRQFIDEGRPVLGICNGFQVLVRAGLLPGRLAITSNSLSAIPLSSLTDNASAQFECRWVKLSVEPSVCIFTRGGEGSIELPVAHGEGRFVLADTAMLNQLQINGQVPLVYANKIHSGREAIAYPENPNGSIGNIAGICNSQGNVFGLMPHPERYISARQHPQLRRTGDGQGDGLFIFKNAYEYAKQRGRVAR